jgi:hypothetical protein
MGMEETMGIGKIARKFLVWLFLPAEEYYGSRYDRFTIALLIVIMPLYFPGKILGEVFNALVKFIIMPIYKILEGTWDRFISILVHELEEGKK